MMAWFDTGGDPPPYEPPASAVWMPQHLQSIHPDDDERAEPEFTLEGRCPHCLAWLAADQWCGCDAERPNQIAAARWAEHERKAKRG